MEHSNSNQTKSNQIHNNQPHRTNPTIKLVPTGRGKCTHRTYTIGTNGYSIIDKKKPCGEINCSHAEMYKTIYTTVIVD